MLQLKELYKISQRNINGISPQEFNDFRLEQAEFDKKSQEWDVVVSFLLENTNQATNPFAPLIAGLKYERVYKKLKLDSVGNLIGFYIYNNDSN